jgi:hypothetical protein
MPPTIAHTLVRKCKNEVRSSVYRTCSGKQHVCEVHCQETASRREPCCRLQSAKAGGTDVVYLIKFCCTLALHSTPKHKICTLQKHEPARSQRSRHTIRRPISSKDVLHSLVILTLLHHPPPRIEGHMGANWPDTTRAHNGNYRPSTLQSTRQRNPTNNKTILRKITKDDLQRQLSIGKRFCSSDLWAHCPSAEPYRPANHEYPRHYIGIPSTLGPDLSLVHLLEVCPRIMSSTFPSQPEKTMFIDHYSRVAQKQAPYMPAVVPSQGPII